MTHNQRLFEKFQKKANLKHNNKYKDGYGDVVYISCFTPIRILCPEPDDGYFTQKPSDHLQGNGCQKCGRRSIQKSQRSSPEYFLQRAYEVHGDRYEYPDIETSYVNAKTAITMICRKHGPYEQTPDDHLSGCGCPDCGKETIIEKATVWTQESFIAACKEKHQGFFEYSKTVFKGIHEKITVTCPVDGDFDQLAASHLRHACDDCAIRERGKQRRLGKEKFVEMANELHGGKFDYSKFEYTNYTSPSTIICPKDGEFEQSPAQHLRKRTGGGDCPECSKKMYSIEGIQYVEYLQATEYPKLQHAKNGGEYRIEGTRYRADGYDPLSNTVFEFQGCYYHGCERCFPDRSFMTHTSKTAEELFARTRQREQEIRSLGYNYVEMWQCQWRIERALQETGKV